MKIGRYLLAMLTGVAAFWSLACPGMADSQVVVVSGGGKDESQAVVVSGGGKDESQAVVVSGGGKDESQAVEPDEKTMQEYQQRLRDVHGRMRRARLRIINDDHEINKMHRQIMSLYRELALKVERHEDMLKLIEEEREIRAKLDDVVNKFERWRILREAEKARDAAREPQGSKPSSDSSGTRRR